MTIYADDLSPGQEIALSSWTLAEGDIIDYARQWDPVYIHTDPGAARAAGLDGVVASGLHTLAIHQRLLVNALWSRVAGGIGRSFDVRFRRPAPPGTVLTGVARVRSVSPRPERGDALVVVDSGLTDQDGGTVLEVAVDCVLPLRAAAD